MENKESIAKIFANPFYTQLVHPIFSEPHTFLASREQWVRANIKCIEDIGAEKWLNHLLDNLLGDYL